MFAKNQSVKYNYQNAWDSLVLKRKYVAVLEGIPEKKQASIKSYLKETKTLMVYSTNDKKDGKLAITNYKVIKSNDKYSLLDIEIKTGRKNQIRVHMSDIGNPILGDKKYGNKKSFSKRLMLHAYNLEILNPKTKRKMIFSCNVPKQFLKLFEN